MVWDGNEGRYLNVPEKTCIGHGAFGTSMVLVLDNGNKILSWGEWANPASGQKLRHVCVVVDSENRPLKEWDAEREWAKHPVSTMTSMLQAAVRGAS